MAVDEGAARLRGAAPDFGSHAASAFRRIACPGIADIAKRAIAIRDSLGSHDPAEFYAEPPTPRMAIVVERLDHDCDRPFFRLRQGSGKHAAEEDVDLRCFEYICRNVELIRLP
ncbi:MAG: hypothetical protein FJX57_24445 [Alphaproteobacteria bacterium]|nr:hypothetical protein [Alphaproteobacteria bacterium]